MHLVQAKSSYQDGKKMDVEKNVCEGTWSFPGVFRALLSCVSSSERFLKKTIQSPTFLDFVLLFRCGENFERCFLDLRDGGARW